MESNDAVETLDYNPTYSENNQQDSSVKLAEREKITIKGGKIYAFFKRVFDIVCSLLAIIVLAIPMLIVGIIVKCTSKGPMIFKDNRIGLNGKKINVWKFRSMYIDAESNIDKYLTPEQKLIWEKERKLDNDPRITSIGKFIRKTSIDELPQLFNILAGTISIVGPRPISENELNENYDDYQKEILLKVKPGLTGYWQVYGRSDVDYESGKRQEEELKYLSKRSFFFDLKLILLTIPAVIERKGAK